MTFPPVLAAWTTGGSCTGSSRQLRDAVDVCHEPELLVHEMPPELVRKWDRVAAFGAQPGLARDRFQDLEVHEPNVGRIGPNPLLEE